MLRRVGKFIFVLIGAGLGYRFGDELFSLLDPLLNFGVVAGSQYIGAVLGAILFFFLANWVVDYVLRIVRWGEETLVKMPVVDVMFGAMGLISGLIVAFLLFLPISKIPIPFVGDLLPLIVSGLLGYLGFQVGFRKRDEIMSVFSIGRKDKKKDSATTTVNLENKILDTSVIIDGRIADICRTGFLEGVLVIPGFVLEELQHIADSSDVLKRNRGRRGLDILNKIQKEMKVKVQIWEGDFEEVSEVDSKLIKLAKLINGKVVTNDFNLNKVCELQGVAVLNINDLANAVKPVVLPGEEMNVQVIKDGKEHGQGVAYLDDGTMIVVEGGREYIGNDVDVLVTSVLQTSAGRMIFAKPKLLERAL
ncbi:MULTISPECIES: PIN/TRAM domain-containing protein [Brevibacillus]|uniref:TRAM domain-containing protein n=1 Tax=Brevibacillus brevis (strain 47 / JCM 6285 / NBRC 100599) TaxID=358681 RepID=C0ZIF2_BREBN|nr:MULTISPECIES: PIN/TRAM domain-containing protein [Bacillales]NQF17734.1 PIN/TRAM domain-containing protein [Brevibacillus sp. HB1.3]NRR05909.1 PIN/TRAM domain-containing protein [Brevibacillus sp. RS1.1]NRS50767.1 PIN/TRAM domain-containing protein [Brevibacillus sp. HB2.2]TQR29640.1 PIN/TRAM domain-containing protein [Lysinibacillus sp. SDF0063]UIO42768.1 PIN/TRAM domain-containing protein [Brevibacillus brevis]